MRFADAQWYASPLRKCIENESRALGGSECQADSKGWRALFCSCVREQVLSLYSQRQVKGEP
jgi:hypothetical protein